MIEKTSAHQNEILVPVKSEW